MISLTILIITHNEAANIGRTLSVISHLGPALIVDSFSKDATLEIAAASNAKVRVVQRRFDTFAGQCNFGLTQIETPWVLSLDADYVLTAELVSEIQSLEPGAAVSGYDTRFNYCIHGHALRASLYPPRTVLYRREAAIYEDEGHGHRVQIKGDVRRLQGKIDHDDRKPLTRWIAAQDRYSILEARHLLRTCAEELSAPDRLRKRIFFAPAAVFVYLLFGKGLILDGWLGWYYVFQRTIAEMLLSLRLLIEREELESSPEHSGPGP